MFVAILGLILGIIIGMSTKLSIPAELARYSAVALLGVLDSILGALKADLEKNYKQVVFLTGLLTNMVLAGVITYIGDKLSLDLYLGVIVVFSIRIFNNLAGIRYYLLDKWILKEPKKLK
jgi:small basic protein